MAWAPACQTGTQSLGRQDSRHTPLGERETECDVERISFYVALVDSVVKGTLPPPSVYPRVIPSLKFMFVNGVPGIEARRVM